MADPLLPYPCVEGDRIFELLKEKDIHLGHSLNRTVLVPAARRSVRTTECRAGAPMAASD